MASKLYFVLIVFTLFIGCRNIEPREFHFGTDSCAHCRMIISDKRFGAELITSKGKIETFDSIECLVEYLQAKSLSGASFWVVDFSTGSFVEATKAFFVKSEELRSPMGGSLAAFSDYGRAIALLSSKKGEILHWDQVKTGVEMSHDSHAHTH